MSRQPKASFAAIERDEARAERDDARAHLARILDAWDDWGGFWDQDGDAANAATFESVVAAARGVGTEARP